MDALFMLDSIIDESDPDVINSYCMSSSHTHKPLCPTLCTHHTHTQTSLCTHHTHRDLSAQLCAHTTHTHRPLCAHTTHTQTSLPNSVHCFQTAERIREAHPDKEWFHLTGLIHDIGKVSIAASHLVWSDSLTHSIPSQCSELCHCGWHYFTARS